LLEKPFFVLKISEMLPRVANRLNQANILQTSRFSSFERTYPIIGSNEFLAHSSDPTSTVHFNNQSRHKKVKGSFEICNFILWINYAVVTAWTGLCWEFWTWCVCHFYIKSKVSKSLDLLHTRIYYQISLRICRQLLQKEGPFPKHAVPQSWIVYNRLFDVKRGLFFLEGPDWWKLRQRVNPIMNKNDAISSILSWSEKVTENLIDELEAELRSRSKCIHLRIQFTV